MPYKRKFDCINLWDGGLAFDAEIYSREEAIKKFKKESWEAAKFPECTEKWARSECRNDIGDMDGPGHCYIIYDEQVKRSFRVWEVR